MRLIDADALEKRFEHLATVGNDLVHKVTEEEKGMRTAYRLAKYETHVAPAIAPESLRPQWIPVTDRLPEEKQRVLVRCKTVGTTVGWRLWGEWMTDLGDGGSEVAHWLPLPEPHTADAEENEGVQPAHWEKTDIPLPYQMRTVPTPSGTFAHREMYVCSACDGYNDKNTQYCPHCGAKMDRKDGNG